MVDFDIISQTLIAIFGISAVYLSQQSNDDLKKWASVCGLISQPFWFYSMVQSEQYIIVLLCVLYTISWGVGFRNYWIRGAA